MRIFIGIRVGYEAGRVIHRVGREIMRKYPFVKITPKENLHITLRFLGEMSNGDVIKLKDAFDPFDIKPFEVKLTKVGGFPTEWGARVVWIGVSNERILSLLSEKVDSIVDNLGFPERDKPFIPHITFIRTKKPINVEGFTIDSVSFKVGSVVIFQSILAKPDAIYKPLKEISLAGS